MAQRRDRPLRRLVPALIVAAVLAGVLPVSARQAEAPQALTAADYARAERFMGYNTAPLVFHAAVRPTWLDDDRFWYRNAVPGGAEFMMANPAAATKARAFDHARVAATLSRASGETYAELTLPFTRFDFVDDEQAIEFAAGSRRWRCRVDGTQCEALADASDDDTGTGRRSRTDIPSPDETLTAFVRDYNLWIREIATGKETQLTTDGTEAQAYARNDAGWTRSDTPVLVWSPDSRRIATFRHDSRGVGEMHVVDTKVGHSTVTTLKYPLPGDDRIFMIERVIIDVDPVKVTKLDLPPDPHRSTLCDHVVCGGEWVDVEWSADSRELAFVSSSRDHKRADLRVADAATGAVRNVLSERVESFFESGQGRVNWHYLPDQDEVVWFSRRDNWGHLYLYDAATGFQKNRVTTGDGNVTQVLSVDEEARTIYFVGVGKEAGRDPYFRHYYRVGMDGTGLTLLTPEDADHSINLSPSAEYFVDSYSTPTTPPVSVLRDRDGAVVFELERADITKLIEAGWQPPIPITAKARDGRTDLYGLMYRPTAFDPSRRYPIINHIYPGPQTGSVGSRSFAASRGDAQAIAELGFIVVEIDGMGTPWRSRTFHEAYYGDMGDNTLPDQIAAMRELATRYPWIDIERAGIYGHSGGGFATADAMFRYPDFFKVGVSQAGNHDNRVYEDDWGEKWQGLLAKGTDGKTNYDDQANQTHAENLKGKLLIAHGTLDTNVPPNSTLLVVNALIAANKDFDLIMFPNRGHGFGNEPYMVRRRWDYFVRNLLGAEPPKGYEIHAQRAASPTQ